MTKKRARQHAGEDLANAWGAYHNGPAEPPPVDLQVTAEELESLVQAMTRHVVHTAGNAALLGDNGGWRGHARVARDLLRRLQDLE